MMRRHVDLRWLTASVLALAFPGAVASQSTAPAAEGAQFLLLPVGAQAVSLGRAMTWVEGPEGAFWNPAGLVGAEEGQAVLFRSDHVVGQATALTTLWARPGVGTLGFSYFLLDAGELEQRDNLGNLTGTITIRDHLGVVSGAARLSSILNLGLNFKVLRFQLSCRGQCSDEGSTATTYALDAGLQATPTDRLRLGAMVAHLGPRLQVRNAEQADPLPARVRLAAAYDLLALTESGDLRGWLAIEIEDRLRELGSTSVYFGTEVRAGAEDALALRAGYVISELDSEEALRAGLGLEFERFELSIAKSLAVSSVTGETEPIHVTFAIAF